MAGYPDPRLDRKKLFDYLLQKSESITKLEAVAENDSEEQYLFDNVLFNGVTLLPSVVVDGFCLYELWHQL